MTEGIALVGVTVVIGSICFGRGDIGLVFLLVGALISLYGIWKLR